MGSNNMALIILILSYAVRACSCVITRASVRWATACANDPVRGNGCIGAGLCRQVQLCKSFCRQTPTGASAPAAVTRRKDEILGFTAAVALMPFYLFATSRVATCDVQVHRCAQCMHSIVRSAEKDSTQRMDRTVLSAV